MVLMDVGAYRKSAELHELFMAEPWARLVPTIRSALPSLRPDAALVDVGAGSGMGLVSLCPGLPGSVYAVEPDDTMRTALIARLAALPELRDRTTVLPVTIEEAVHLLPRSWDALWCAHTLGHLGREGRNVLWRALGERLTAQGVAVLTVAADHDPAAVTTEEEHDLHRPGLRWTTGPIGRGPVELRHGHGGHGPARSRSARPGARPARRACRPARSGAGVMASARRTR
jgi:hypothetical protein